MHSSRSSYKQLRLNFKILEHAYLYRLNEQTLFETALFSPVVNDSDLFNSDAIEPQLAHVPQNRIRSAYNRAQYWDERVKIMEWYGEKVKEWLS